MAVEPVIYNCHIHTFTHRAVPDRFLHPVLMKTVKAGPIRRVLQHGMARFWPFDSRDRLERYANFLDVSHQKTQEQVFERIRPRYPSKTRFVVLPMDMAKMGSGDVEQELEEQHAELAQLRDNYPDNVIPFAAVDPRRRGVLDHLKDLIEKKNFRGIKLYPNLGYSPTEGELKKIWKYADDRGLPVITHCSRGGPRGILGRNASMPVTDRMLDRLTAPVNYKPVLKKYPNVKICLAHFGGEAEWHEYLGNPPIHDAEGESWNWVKQILDMMRSGDHPNLYADISYTVFKFQEFVPPLKVFLSNEAVREHTLFGSDFYMIENERYREKQLSMNLRASLGEDLFWQIANKNPKQFLGE